MFLGLFAFAALAVTILASPQVGRLGCGTETPEEFLRAVELAAAEEAAGNVTLRNYDESIDVDVFFHLITDGDGLENGWVDNDTLHAQFNVLKSERPSSHVGSSPPFHLF
jgi:hypothetical protein